MSTLSSWIDPDEISDLMPILMPELRPEPSAESEGKPENRGEPEEEREPALAPETESEPDALETKPGVDFEAPDAYDAAAFPRPAEEEREAHPVSDRPDAAVQAAVALERARDRASEGGLLRHSPVVVEQEIREEGMRSDEAATVGTPEDPESPPPPESETPGTLRHRLAEFAASAQAVTGCSGVAVSDDHSFPLFSGEGAPAPAAAIVRLNRLVGQLPDQGNGSCERTSQIALDENDWLCVLAREGSAGSVFATFRIADPLTPETAQSLHTGLRTALAGG